VFLVRLETAWISAVVAVALEVVAVVVVQVAALAEVATVEVATVEVATVEVATVEVATDPVKLVMKLTRTTVNAERNVIQIRKEILILVIAEKN
jgi:hypothetical protein